jgi:hypothetical protein
VADGGKPTVEANDLLKTKVEVFEARGQAAWERFKNRREYEWKISYGIWTACGIASGFLLSSSAALSSLWQVVALTFAAIFVVVVYAFKWMPYVQQAHHLDQNFMVWCEEQALASIGVSIPEDLTPPHHFQLPPSPNTLHDRFRVIGHRAAISQILTTLLFAIIFILALWSRYGPPKPRDEIVIKGIDSSRVSVAPSAK